MKKLNEKHLCARLGMTLMTITAAATPAFASTNKSLYDVVAPIVDLLNSFLGPVLLVVGAVGTLYCVLLGVKYARAEEPQDREKAKAHLKSAVIGFILIFVLIVALNLLTDYLVDWASNYQTVLKQ